MPGQYVVTAACVVAKTDSATGEGYFYKDAILPAGVPAKEKKRLADDGLVKFVEDEASAPADDGAAPDDDAAADGGDSGSPSPEPDAPVVPDAPAEPARRTQRSSKG